MPASTPATPTSWWEATRSAQGKEADQDRDHRVGGGRCARNRHLADLGAAVEDQVTGRVEETGHDAAEHSEPPEGPHGRRRARDRDRGKDRHCHGAGHENRHEPAQVVGERGEPKQVAPEGDRRHQGEPDPGPAGLGHRLDLRLERGENDEAEHEHAPEGLERAERLAQHDHCQQDHDGAVGGNRRADDRDRTQLECLVEAAVGGHRHGSEPREREQLHRGGSRKVVERERDDHQ